MEDIEKRIQQAASGFSEEIKGIRRHIHANPELSFREFETSKYVSSKLEEWGVPYQSGFVGTGIIGLIRGKDPDSGTIALRADMDALPIQEENEVPYKSLNPGVMHACGHDVHTSCLLGAARILNDMRDQFKGTVKLIFQPGEERNPGGASKMIEEGVLKDPDVDAIVGEHVYPDLEVGKVGFKPGKYMASTDEVNITVFGKGGHAALPHKNVDPVLIASHLITSLQQLVSRVADPEMPSVLSFGKVIADGATNVIPDQVRIEGTFRTFDEDWRTKAHSKMKEMGVGLVESMGGKCEFLIDRGYPYLTNHPELTDRVKGYAEDLLGKENVVDLSLRMTAEDFAYYSQEVPGCFYRLGTGNSEKGITSGLHTSTFDVDEEALEIGMGLMAYTALRELGGME